MGEGGSRDKKIKGTERAERERREKEGKRPCGERERERDSNRETQRQR